VARVAITALINLLSLKMASRAAADTTFNETHACRASFEAAEVLSGRAIFGLCTLRAAPDLQIVCEI